MNECELVVGDEQYRALVDVIFEAENGEAVTITRDGKAVAVILGIEELETLKKAAGVA